MTPSYRLPPVPPSTRPGSRPAPRPAAAVRDHRPAGAPTGSRHARPGRSRAASRLHAALLVVATVLVVVGSAFAVSSPATSPASRSTAERPAWQHAVTGTPGLQRKQRKAEVEDATVALPALPAPASAAPVVPTPEPVAPSATQSAATKAAPSTPPAAASRAIPKAPAPPAAPAAGAITGNWLSGASGPEVPDGSFASWRGTPLGIAGTWSDNNNDQVGLWSIRSGGELASWTKPVDIAIGAIGPGESWAAASQGAYDSRWRQSLTNLRDFWGNRPATLYIRFAHEMNGNWYPWAVDSSETGDFVAAWRHFRALQQQIFPASKLVFCVNRESVGSGFDWRKSFPGAQYVDVMSVDYYNQWPYVGSDADWTTSLNATDQYGAPKGLQAHLDFARSVGLPLAVSEWSGNADQGDSPVFVRHMHDFFAQHGGTGAGALLYEIIFNVPGYNGQFVLNGSGVRMPQSAQAYRDAF